MFPSIESVKQAVSTPCEEFGVKRLEIFGSIARGHADPDSDLDFIVEFLNETPHGYSKRFFGLQSSLEELLGRKVDLLTDDQIQNPYFKSWVNQDRASVYG